VRRRAQAQFAIAKFEGDEVDRNCDEDADVKSDPKPDARLHGGESFMRRGEQQPQIAMSARPAYTSDEA
jgi:hypothetical protein